MREIVREIWKSLAKIFWLIMCILNMLVTIIEFSSDDFSKATFYLIMSIVTGYLGGLFDKEEE